MNQKVAIIILNYNGWKDTIECLESLRKIDYPDYLTIVVDNGSSDGSIEKIKSWAEGKLETNSEYVKYAAQNKPIYVVEYEKEIAEKGGIDKFESELQKYSPNRKIVLIKNNKNLGFSGGNNVGAKYAIQRNVKYIILLNNDTIIIDIDFMNKIIDAFRYDDNIFVVGPNIVNFSGSFDGPFIHETFLGELFFLSLKNQIHKLLRCQPVYIDIKAISSPKPLQVYKISGACLVFKSTFLKEIGYLDENAWLSCEEAILAEQVIAKDGKIYFQPLTLLLHKKARSPRNDSSRVGILSNYFKQREYFLKTYRRYGALKISFIKFAHTFRLLLEKIRA